MLQAAQHHLVNFLNCSLAFVWAHLHDSNPLSVPMLPKQVLPKTEGLCPDMEGIPYQEAIELLMYTAVSTQPDIAYATNTLSQFNENPSHDHWTAVKRVLQYLKGTQDWGIVYQASGTENTALAAVVFSDVDWGTNPEDRKSISGYVFYLAGGAVSWLSRKQKSIVLSTLEAEYMAGSAAASHAQ
jgi:hypothetical protein